MRKDRYLERLRRGTIDTLASSYPAKNTTGHSRCEHLPGVVCFTMGFDGPNFHTTKSTSTGVLEARPRSLRVRARPEYPATGNVSEIPCPYDGA